MTLREVGMVLEGSMNRQKRNRNELVSLAWHVEAFARQKKLPRLSDLLKDDAPTGRRMTPEQIEAITKSWLGSRHKKDRK